MNLKKSKMGRPPKPAEEKQAERVTVRMTRRERRLLGQEAAEANLTMSAYLLQCWKKRRR